MQHAFDDLVCVCVGCDTGRAWDEISLSSPAAAVATTGSPPGGAVFCLVCPISCRTRGARELHSEQSRHFRSAEPGTRRGAWGLSERVFCAA